MFSLEVLVDAFLTVHVVNCDHEESTLTTDLACASKQLIAGYKIFSAWVCRSSQYSRIVCDRSYVSSFIHTGQSTYSILLQYE